MFDLCPFFFLFSKIRHTDESLTEYSDRVYEHETRKYPGGDWEEGNPKYVDLVRKNPLFLCKN